MQDFSSKTGLFKQYFLPVALSYRLCYMAAIVGTVGKIVFVHFVTYIKILYGTPKRKQTLFSHKIECYKWLPNSALVLLWSSTGLPLQLLARQIYECLGTCRLASWKINALGGIFKGYSQLSVAPTSCPRMLQSFGRERKQGFWNS